MTLGTGGKCQGSVDPTAKKRVQIDVGARSSDLDFVVFLLLLYQVFKQIASGAVRPLPWSGLARPCVTGCYRQPFS